MSSAGLIVLAAGASARMGTPKQLLRLQGQTLVRRALEAALASVCCPVVVVLGANAVRIQPELNGLPARMVENPHWQEGMGTSLKTGMAAMLQEAEDTLDAVVLMLCDQPLVSSEVLDRLVEIHQETASPLVASEYGGTLGVPALFHRSLFPELLALGGEEGARSLIRRHRAATMALPFPEGTIDLDSLEDFERFREAWEKKHTVPLNPSSD